MEAIAQKLLELLLSAVPTFLIVLGLYGVLRAMFFSPLQRVLEKRDEATAGARRAAEQSMAAAEAKAAEYAAALNEVRTEIYREREWERQRALEERSEMVKRARAQAQERLHAARQEMAAEVAAAREGLREQSHAMAHSIVEAILK